MLRIVIAVALWFAATEIVTAQQNGPPESQIDTRPIPGLTGEDTHPEACVSCHIKMDDIGLDARLSTALAEWRQEVPEKVMSVAEIVVGSAAMLQGRHPPVALPLEDVPSSCIACHDVASSGPAFAPLVHLAHYRGAEANHYVSVFAGECTHCHKMDWQSGTWRVPSGAER